MQVSVKIDGLDAVKRQLGNAGKQAAFAASKALNATAFAVNAKIKADMQSTFKGGATAYSLRAFKVERSTKGNLVATIALRDDSPAGGTSYNKALRHLFSAGTREWKKLEGYLRANGLMPEGLMAVPGAGCPLDAKGNIRRNALAEMIGVLKSNRTNLRVYRRTGAGKAQKAVGFFVVMPRAESHLPPGIYKRIETGNTSAVSPFIMFVRPGQWRKSIDLADLANAVVARTFNAAFSRELDKALASAR